jgi:hypothetical protein
MFFYSRVVTNPDVRKGERFKECVVSLLGTTDTVTSLRLNTLDVVLVGNPFANEDMCHVFVVINLDHVWRVAIVHSKDINDFVAVVRCLGASWRCVSRTEALALFFCEALDLALFREVLALFGEALL